MFEASLTVQLLSKLVLDLRFLFCDDVVRQDVPDNSHSDNSLPLALLQPLQLLSDGVRLLRLV